MIHKKSLPQAVKNDLGCSSHPGCQWEGYNFLEIPLKNRYSNDPGNNFYCLREAFQTITSMVMAYIYSYNYIPYKSTSHVGYIYTMTMASVIFCSKDTDVSSLGWATLTKHEWRVKDRGLNPQSLNNCGPGPLNPLLPSPKNITYMNQTQIYTL